MSDDTRKWYYETLFDEAGLPAKTCVVSLGKSGDGVKYASAGFAILSDREIADNVSVKAGVQIAFTRCYYAYSASMTVHGFVLTPGVYDEFTTTVHLNPSRDHQTQLPTSAFNYGERKLRLLTGLFAGSEGFREVFDTLRFSGFLVTAKRVAGFGGFKHPLFSVPNDGKRLFGDPRELLHESIR